MERQFLRAQPFRQTIGRLMRLSIIDLSDQPPVSRDRLVNSVALVTHIRGPNLGDELSPVDFVPI
jgi:hypothetical protein